jgi:uncharacterized DUF497 family protein
MVPWRTLQVGLAFRWDRRKAASNLEKHGVSFEEAASVFGDPLSLTIPDPGHSEDETRFVIVGESPRGRLLVVVHAEDQGTIRVISARAATPSERRSYEED